MEFLQLGLEALLLSAILCRSPTFASAANTVNRTIDDSYGDSQTGQLVVYLPEVDIPWHNQTCGGCAIRPDVSQVFMGTYTAATYHPGRPPNMNITMQFNGIAIYVFFILFNNAGSGVTTMTEVNFTVDGNSPVFFQHIPDTSTNDILFNQLVFHQQGLENVQHTLVISTSGVDDAVYVNFDYAIYTHVDIDPPVSLSAPESPTSPTPSSVAVSPPTSVGSVTGTTTALSSSSDAGNMPSPNSPISSDSTSSSTATEKSVPTGVIIGSIIGGIVIMIIGVTILLLCLCRQTATSHIPRLMVNMKTAFERPSATEAVDPFTLQPVQQYTPPPSGIQSEYGPYSSKYVMSSRQGSSSRSTATTKTEAALRSRQQELDRRLRALQEQVAVISANFEKGQVSGQSDTDARKQLRRVQREITLLSQAHQQPTLAQGLLNDQPPGYHQVVRRQS